MYLKQDNTYVTSDFQHLPLNDLTIGDQIMMLNGKSNGMFTFSEKSRNKLIYLFQGYNTDVRLDNNDIYENDDAKEPLYMNEHAYMEFDKANELYILLYDTLISLERPSRDVEMPTSVNALNNKDEDIIGVIYNDVYKTNAFFFDYIHRRSLGDMNYHYIITKLDDENSIAFVTLNSINSKKRHWNMCKYCYLFNKNGDVISLRDYFGELYDFVKDKVISNSVIKSFTEERFKEFDNILNIMNPYMPLNQEHIQKRVNETYAQLKNVYDYDTIVELFSPIYSSETIDLKSYVSRLNNYFSSSFRYALNDEKFDYNFARKYPESFSNINIDDIEEEQRAAEAASEFHFNECFNPITGEFKEIKDKPNANQFIYKDAGGFILKNPSRGWNSQTHYYLNMKGYYVIADMNNERDKKLVNELKQRQETFKKLEAAL